MQDRELKKGCQYWAEVIDQESGHLGKQIKVKFAGILFYDTETPSQSYYLSQLKIFREVKTEDNNVCKSNQI